MEDRIYTSSFNAKLLNDFKIEEINHLQLRSQSVVFEVPYLLNFVPRLK
jgi:hypothetical protein